MNHLSRAFRVLLALLCVLLVSAASFAQSPAEVLPQKLQSKLDALLAKGPSPGATVGVALDQGTVLALASGWTDRTKRQRLSPEALLLQGSVGKTYVAAVAMQLVHEKKLGLDDKIDKYLEQAPWFQKLPNARDITVKMLLNHTSGIMRYEFQPQFTADLTKEPAKVWKPEELLGYILGKSPRFAAGKGWEYSDTNYIVLGLIIEKVTGDSYEHEVRRRILEPLHLQKTTLSNQRKIPGLTQGFAGPRNPFGGQDAMLNEQGEMIINPQFEWTGGGMASSAADLARWAKMLYEGKAFDSSLLPTMLDGVPARMLGPEAKYGLGVILRPTALGMTYGHSGFFPGYMAEVCYWPDRKMAIAVQVNTSEIQKLRPRLFQWCVELAEETQSESKK